jgi:V/A-type H+/Na+-transporting ATPase subunit K
MEVGVLLDYVTNPNVLAAFGAAIGVSLAGYGASTGLGISGSTAAALTAEQEKNFVKILILEVAPQTQVLYAFVVSTFILNGMMGGQLTAPQGFMCLAAGICVGVSGLTAISQGKAASAALAAYGRNNNIPFKVLVFVVMCEISAILGFITGLLILISAKVIGA